MTLTVLLVSNRVKLVFNFFYTPIQMISYFVGTNPLSRQRMELSRFPESSLPIKSLVRLPCNGIGVDSDTAWNELHTPAAARMSVGCVLELAFR